MKSPSRENTSFPTPTPGTRQLLLTVFLWTPVCINKDRHLREDVCLYYKTQFFNICHCSDIQFLNICTLIFEILDNIANCLDTLIHLLIVCCNPVLVLKRPCSYSTILVISLIHLLL